MFKSVEIQQAQPIICKDSKKRLIAARNHILLCHVEATTRGNNTSLHRKTNQGQTGRREGHGKYFSGQLDTKRPTGWRITMLRHTFWTSKSR